MTPYHDYHVGQDVACINAGIEGEQYIELTEGGVYRLRWVGMFTHYIYGEYLGVKLEGVERMECPQFGYRDMPYRADRFRPLAKDPLAVLRQAAADPRGPVQGDVEAPRRRAPAKEEEKV